MTSLLATSLDPSTPTNTAASFDDLLERILADPGFDRAARTLAASMLTLTADNPQLDKIFKDAGKYVAALCATALHGEGLTLVALKNLCARFGLLSAGRVRALLLFMRYLGFVSMWSDREGGGPARYAVSAPFLDDWRRHLDAALAAASIVDATAATAAKSLQDPRFFADFCRLHAEGLAETMGREPADFAILKVFIERNAGPQIVWALVSQGAAEFPTREPLDLQRATLARRFGVSRMHVRRIVQDACDQHLLIALDDGGFQFTERARSQLRFFYCAQLAQLILTSHRALQRVPRRRT